MEIGAETSQNILKLFLTRSQNTPLHIHLHWQYSNQQAPKLRATVALILSHINRWFHLRISGFGITAATWSASIGSLSTELHAPVLQQLELFGSRMPEIGHWSVLHCPELRGLHCNYTPFIHLPSTRGLLNASLRVESAATFNFIAGKVRLELLKIDFKCRFEKDSDTITRLPNMSSLSITFEFDYLSDVMNFVSQLRSTSLRTLNLHIEPYGTRNGQYEEPFPSLPSITSLLLRVNTGSAYIPDHLLRILRRFTSSYSTVARI